MYRSVESERYVVLPVYQSGHATTVGAMDDGIDRQANTGMAFHNWRDILEEEDAARFRSVADLE